MSISTAYAKAFTQTCRALQSATSARDARFRNKPYGAAMERNATVGSYRNFNFNIQEGFKTSFESSCHLNNYTRSY